jgi:hypothetical protein
LRSTFAHDCILPPGADGAKSEGSSTKAG